MAGNSKDSKILAYKDMINQLNKTISTQTELIQSLQKTLEADRLEKENLRQQIEYLTKKLFGTSSEKRKDIDGQLNLFDEAGQEEDWKQLGVPLSRATLANWIIYCAENYLRHVYDYFHCQLRMRKYLMADETRVQVLNEPERNPETDSWMWLFRSGEDGLPPILLYHYTETRAKFHAASFLQGFSGYLETDGYQGYNNLPDIKRCSCWAHVRRYFTDAIPKGKEYDYSLPAVQGVQFCCKLFDCERYSKAKNHTAEQRKQFRLEKEKPILEAFWNWLDQQRPNKGTRLAKAVNYAQNRKDTLMTYLENGHCSLSNNLSENAIRPFTVGRKNWLFSASPKGATASAIVYTIVEMAKANALNTYKYLTYLLSQRQMIKCQMNSWNNLLHGARLRKRTVKTKIK